MMSKTGLPEEIKEAKYQIEWFMTQVCGLEPFFYWRENGRRKKSAVVFEICDWQKMYELAAYTGFPVRYPHYRFGLEYNRLIKGHEYGLQKIYEMVINNNPVFAYLLAGNNLVDQKLVMAHVYAHADFFVNNVYFAHTNRKAVDMMANHAVRIRECQDQHGAEEVERWLDVGLSLENLVDRHHPALRRAADKDRRLLIEKENEEDKKKKFWNGRFPAKDYMEGFVNPPEELKAHGQWLEKKLEQEEDVEQRMIFPPEPVKDVLQFLIENAPLKQWQREVLSIIRAESYYFVPQAQTKIMNEGWAAYWHSVAMTKLLSDEEIVDYLDHNSGTLALGGRRINPYLLGREMFRDIVYRWDSHRHGEIYGECRERVVLANWDQFVAFKNIYEAGDGQWREMAPRWREFLRFWKAVRDPERICGAVYNPWLLLRWWHYYQNIDELLRKHKVRAGVSQKKIAYCDRMIGRYADNGLKKRLYEKIREFTVNHILPLWQREGVIVEELVELRRQIRAGQLKEDEFQIPSEFWRCVKDRPGFLPIGQGREKIFEVRRFCCDLSFIEEFLTAELCRRLRLFSFKYDEHSEYYVIDSREAAEVRKRFSEQLANIGSPVIAVEDGNFDNGKELLLRHYYEGTELKNDYARATLENLYKVWRRPVHIKTFLEDSPVLMSYDGQDHHQEVTN